jgi:type II secretory pathway predicted ATPase ExeA
MYESFYGLNEKPFQIVPSPKYLYRSEKHQNALTYLEYGLTENVGFILLTGEIGSGKTTLVQYLLSQLDPSTAAAVISNSRLSAGELLRMILTQFELTASADKIDNLNALNDFLIRVYGAGRQALLIIDEAQNLTADGLEEVRMLTNLHSENHALLQIVLVGQPELKAQLTLPGMRQLAQRVAVRYHLTGLNREETGRYIAARLATAGGRPDLFTPAAVDLIYRISGGIPRAINLACQAALVYGLAEEAASITQDIVRKIMADNLGVGLAAPGAAESTEPGAPADHGAAPHVAGNGFNERLSSIEASVRSLQTLVDRRLSALEQGLVRRPDDAVQKLAHLLKTERERHQALAAKHARLEAGFLKLKQLVEQARARALQQRAGSPDSRSTKPHST